MAINLFNSIKASRPTKNSFDLSHDVKLSCNMGELIPIMITECVPGDTFKLSCESLVRFAPLVSPVMHRMDVSMHYFFVPTRILWDNWDKFISNQKLESTGELPVHPFVDINNDLTPGTTMEYTRLMDYLGLPSWFSGAQTERISPMALAAYQCVYSEYYRDQNLMSETAWKLTDGNNSANTDLSQLRRRCWEHDYFTAALPWAQKGDPVSMPVSGDVTLKPGSEFQSPVWKDTADYGLNVEGDIIALGAPLIGVSTADDGGTLKGATYDPNGTLEVNNVTTTINDLRRATRLQEWLEKAARGGSRLKEVIWNYFGVRTSDARLQRPEYITGTKSPVVISEILNTTGTEDLPQGNMAGHGASVTSGKYGSKFCEEHGYIIGVMSIMPKTAYQQGINKMFLKYKDPFQFYWPQFANIGEQEVESREVFGYQGSSGDDPFGYVPRYAEYKFEQSRVAGDFRNSLDFWHLGRKFASTADAVLNSTFVTCDPTHRIFAVEDPDTQKMYCHVYNKVTAIRPMPKFGTPTF